MGEQSPKPTSTPTGAVFLSYASQDAEAAQKICEALRAAGIEVWFDQSELRGGDAWDRKIRKQIHDCALFVPVISAHSDARREGYFRREWKLAVDRTADMAEDVAFLLPAVIDSTPDATARVPDRFRDIQWSRLPDGQASPAFIERVQRLLSPAQDDAATARLAVPSVRDATPRGPRPVPGPSWSKPALLVAVAVVVFAPLAYFAADKFWISKHLTPSPIALAPPQQSIAVLPLANESGDASQQYFSDGLSEDLITALSGLPGLKVIGRHSSFQFRNSKDDSKTIGVKLGVAHLLEGSVRHAGDVVRVSAELINTSDGSTQWSERYDRPYKDLFALQDDITRAVAGALKTRLAVGANATQQNDRPPSGNLEAYNAVLEGKYFLARFTESDTRKAIERFSRATQLDPRYAFAWSLLSRTWTILGEFHLNLAAAPEAYTKGRLAASTAVALAPDLASAHVAQGLVLEMAFDWRGAETEYRRAFELAPGDGDAAVNLARQLANFRHVDSAIDLTQQALATDPLHSSWYAALAVDFYALNRLEEAEGAIRRAIELQPGGVWHHDVLTNIEVQRGDAQAALVAAQQEPVGSFFRDAALAKALQISSDRTAADAAFKNLLHKGASWDPYEVAQIYAMRNNADKTFEWLDQAWHYRDPYVHNLLNDPFVGRYKDDPRFAAFCRKVGLPTPAEVERRT